MKDQKPEQSEQDKSQAKKWGKRLQRALDEQKKCKQEEKFKSLRKYVRGDVGDDGQGGLVRTNIIHSNFAAVLPQVYAKNPEVAVTPTESVGDGVGEIEWIGDFCETMRIVLDRKFIRDGRLKKRAKSAIRAAMTTGLSWFKVSWQEDIRRDPLIENRISDTQDNLQRIAHLIDEIEEGDDSRDELEANKAELEQQIQALQSQVEVKVAEGIVIDRPLTEDVFVIDDTLYDFDGYEQAEAIAHRVWMTCDQYEETFGKEPPKTATKYGQDKKDATSKSDNAPQLVAVFEVWSRLSSTVFTLCAGADEWAREPYQPDVTGERFYPFFALAFNPVDGRMEPISDAQLLVELQDEYNTTRTNFAEHRKENVPVRVYRKGGSLTDGDIKSLANRAANEWIGIEGDPNVPIDRDVAILQNPTVDPANYDVTPILRDAEMVFGAGDSAKGTINKAKTATEAEIMSMGLQSRVGERQDVVEDCIAEMAQYAAEIMLQVMSLEQVKRIAGDGAVWPELTKDDIFDLVEIQIRAGSTGRPNQAREREQWAQMLPHIKEAIAQVAELRKAGQEDMADSVIKLMEETLRRFDERIDIESFIPPKAEEQDDGIPDAIKQQVQQLQEQNAELQAALKEAESKQNAEIEQARIKAEAQALSAIEVARIKSESEERIAAMRDQNAEIMKQILAPIQQAIEMMAGRSEVVALPPPNELPMSEETR